MEDEAGGKQGRAQDNEGEGRQQRASGTRRKSTTSGKSRQRSSARTATKKTSSGSRRSGDTERGDQDGQKSKGGRRTKESGADQSTQEREESTTDRDDEESAQESTEQAEQESTEQAEQESTEQAEQESTDQGEQQPSEEQGEQQPSEEQAKSRDGEDAEGPPSELSGVELVKRGKELLAELTGRRPESVSGLDRHDGGWRLTVEVVEVNRIPPTTDVLGTYELDMTESGELTGYRRTDRYYRNQAQQRSE